MAHPLVTSDLQNESEKYLRNENAQMQVSSAKFGFGRYHIPLVRYRFEIEFIFPATPISLLDKWGA
jgi:hypothetical protein